MLASFLARLLACLLPGLLACSFMFVFRSLLRSPSRARLRIYEAAGGKVKIWKLWKVFGHSAQEVKTHLRWIESTPGSPRTSLSFSFALSYLVVYFSSVICFNVFVVDYFVACLALYL